MTDNTPDAAATIRKLEIELKGARTQIQTLRRRLNHHIRTRDSFIAGQGAMVEETQKAILHVLHPDHQPDKAAKTEATQLFLAWRGAKKPQRSVSLA